MIETEMCIGNVDDITVNRLPVARKQKHSGRNSSKSIPIKLDRARMRRSTFTADGGLADPGYEAL